MQLSTTLRHLIRSALLYIQPNICQPSWSGSKIHSQSRFTSPEWHLQSLPESQHDPRPRSVSPFPRHLFLWTWYPPACQQDSLTKAGVKRGLGLPGGSISGIHPPGGGQEEGLMHRGSSMCVPCHQVLCLPMQSHREGFRHKRCTTIQCNQCEELISLITDAIPLRRLQTEKIHHQSMQKTRMTDLTSH